MSIFVVNFKTYLNLGGLKNYEPIGGGKLGKLGGNMWLWGADQLILWVTCNNLGFVNIVVGVVFVGGVGNSWEVCLTTVLVDWVVCVWDTYFGVGFCIYDFNPSRWCKWGWSCVVCVVHFWHWWQIWCKTIQMAKRKKIHTCFCVFTFLMDKFTHTPQTLDPSHHNKYLH